ncbi:MAG: ABC transporter ATP-binding protein, partial [Inquilinus sp.]|nr:ABC transporter ATP-binding protein [Inquilinus sp.]
GRIYEIRYEIFRRKFFIKFLNNFINQLTPFFFYSIGGYLVLQRDLTFGALVAVLAAYKDLSGPWREMLAYYQRVEDIRIKYEQVIQQFQPPDMVPVDQLDGEEALDGMLPATLDFSNVAYAEEDSLPVLDGVSASIPTRGETAVVGPAGSGRDEFMQLLARLLIPTAGRVRFGDRDYADLPESVLGRHIAYVGPQSHLFTDTLRANLYYGLKHRPLIEAQYDEHGRAKHEKRVADARASGNTEDDPDADWIDYAAADVEGSEALEKKGLEVLEAVDMAADVYRMGLNGTIDPADSPQMAEDILRARRAIRARLRDESVARVVEPFDAERYNMSATVAENVLFGTPVGPTFALEGLAEQPYVLEVLEKVGLTQTFIEIGTKVAETMIELFADLPPGHEFFEQFSFISSDDLPDFQPLVVRIAKEGHGGLKAEDRARLMALPFKLIPTRHRLGLIEGDMQEQLLKARRMFADELPGPLRGAVEFFDSDRYNAASTIQDNILFGKIRYGQAGSGDTVQALIAEVVEEYDLHTKISAVGLDFSVGVAGARLSSVQRQKLALARALLKRPKLLILNEATASLDGASQNRVHRTIRRLTADGGLVWAPHRPSICVDFERIVVLKDGRVAGQGDFASLDRDGSVLRGLMAAE